MIYKLHVYIILEFKLSSAHLKKNWFWIIDHCEKGLVEFVNLFLRILNIKSIIILIIKAKKNNIFFFEIKTIKTKEEQAIKNTRK